MPKITPADAARFMSPEQLRQLTGEPEPPITIPEPLQVRGRKPRPKPGEEPEPAPPPRDTSDVALPPGRIGNTAEVADRLWAAGDSALGRVIVHNRSQGNTCGIGCPYLARERFAKDGPSRLSDREAGRSGLVGQVNNSIVEAERLDKYKIRTRAEVTPGWSDRLHWWSQSLWAKDKLGKLLGLAGTVGAPLRLHDRGDFGGFDGRPIDLPYVKSVHAAFSAYRPLGVLAWCFSHVHRPEVAQLDRLADLTVYGIAHSGTDLEAARAAGFTKIAMVLPMRRPGKVRAVLKSLREHAGGETVTHKGWTYKLCPQTLDPKSAPKCSECRYCVEGRGNVAFLMT